MKLVKRLLIILNSGKLQIVKGRYDTAAGAVKFTTGHFSMYAVGYNAIRFSDVRNGSRYDEAIGFMAAREIIRGVGNGRFAPSGNITRADFLIMVMKSYGIEIDTQVLDNFADAGNKYYAAYLATAKRLGLVSGVGNNQYAPEATISRQDMMVILYNILKKLEELPAGDTGRTLGSFEDADLITGYAVDAMKLFAEKGITVGDGQALEPKELVTREEAAAILYHLLSR